VISLLALVGATSRFIAGVDLVEGGGAVGLAVGEGGLRERRHDLLALAVLLLHLLHERLLRRRLVYLLRGYLSQLRLRVSLRAT